MYRVPLVYTARRPFTANGVAYARGEVLPNDALSSLRLGLLVSAGRLLAAPDPHARRAYAALGPQPTYVPGDAYPAETLTAGTITVAIDTDPGDELRITCDADFDGPTAWGFGDDRPSYQGDSHTVHHYSNPGTYTVVAKSLTHEASTSVTVPAVVEDAGEGEATAKSAPKKSDYGVSVTPKPRRSKKSSTTVSSGQDAPA